MASHMCPCTTTSNLERQSSATSSTSRRQCTLERAPPSFRRCARPEVTRQVACSSSGRQSGSLPRRQALLLGICASNILARRAEAATDIKAVIEGGVTTLEPTSVAERLSPAEKKALQNNRRIQAQNNAPPDFPAFVRQGYDIKILADGYEVDEKGLIYKDFKQGTGAQPSDGQEVTFDYVAYNENGNRIDSSYTKGRPASTRLGINGLIPGFELGIKTMQVGGKRRIVVPPELGPPVGPSTFFSAKQCEETFDWIRQWYALAFVDYLDPMKPNLRELLGVRLVIWRDAKGLWRCFEDRCPHRLAPLSEGRIEPSDGTLMCSYHGWRFQGDGQCTDIPQALDSKAKAAAIANPRACAISRPAKVMQGMLFVWGRGGPEAAAEAEAALVPVIPDMEVTEGTPQRLASGHTAVANFAAYYRELPYGWDILAENLQDPSHLPFAHHGVINRRDDDKAGYFEMNISTLDGETGPDVICAEAETVRPLVGDLQKRRFQFRPPGQIRWHTFFRKQPPSGEPWLNLLSFHIVPAGPGRSAVLFSGFFSEAGFRGLPTRLQLRLKLRPKWWSHTFTHNIFDGDSKILYVQERILAESRGADESFSWKKQFFMPAQADRLVMAFRKWLDGRGGGGPQPRLIRPLPPLDDRDGRLLDRYYLHTRHCPYCQGAVRGFTAMQIVAAAVGTMCLLGLSASLGRGLSLFSMYPISMLTGAIASLAAFITAKEVLKRFHYVGYDHSER